MKTMKKHILKKGTSSKSVPSAGVVMKKPASKGAVIHQQLTDAALAKLEGASDSKIEEFLLKLSDKEQMCLWKKFESQRRQDGTDEQYRQAVSGAGMKKKAGNCLKVYLKAGGTTKDSTFQDLVTRVYSTKNFEEKSVWQPGNYMLQKFGMKELKARVLAGTIECRKNPHDPRFPEFRELLESSARKITHENTSQTKTQKKVSASDFLALSNMDLQGMQHLEFSADAEEGDTESMVNSFFGKGAAKDLPIVKKNTKDIVDDDEGNDVFLKDLETASAVQDTTPLPVATLKLLQVKTLAQTVIGELEALANDQPKYKASVAKYKSELKSIMQKIAACEKNLKSKTMKAGVLKKVLVSVADGIKGIKTWLLKVQ